MLQQRTRWTNENARALQTKKAAIVIAKKSAMPDTDVQRARKTRASMTKENKMRARIQVASLSMKYKSLQNSLASGALSKSAFEKAYKLTASAIASDRAQFDARQKDIETSWNLVVQR